MEPFQFLELKHALASLMEEAIENVQKVDLTRYTRPRFVLELSYDPISGLLIDSGIEIRFRRPLKR